MHSSQQAVMHNSLVRLDPCNLPVAAIDSYTTLVNESNLLWEIRILSLQSNTCQRCGLRTVQ